MDSWHWTPYKGEPRTGLPVEEYDLEFTIDHLNPGEEIYDRGVATNVLEHPPLSVNGKVEIINKVDWRFKHLRRGTE